MNLRKVRQKQKKFDYLNDVNWCCFGLPHGVKDPTAAIAIRNVGKKAANK